MRPHRTARRGIIIIVVLGLLTIFTLLALTFVVIANQAQRAAQVAAEVEVTADPPEKLLNTALYQALRGSNNLRSVMGPHSLLEDIYGSGYLLGRVNAAPASVAGGQMIAFEFVPSGGSFSELHEADGYFDGRAITFFTGQAALKTFRVTGYDWDEAAGTARLRVLVPDTAGVADGDTFLINGRPFSGTGFGLNTLLLNDVDSSPTDENPKFDPDSGVYGFLLSRNRQLAAVAGMGKVEYALTPNATQFFPLFTSPPPPSAPLVSLSPTWYEYIDPAGPGGANEDYDAPDYQNMLLGWQETTTGAVLIPSLHRPDLVNYWAQRIADELTGLGGALNGVAPAQVRQAFLTGDTSGDVAPAATAISRLRRAVILRPLPEEHPDFTGSNPAANMANLDFLLHGPWDVDNSGDGRADSIWVDLGLPVQSARDGRRYKPLFAFLCLDLDGRLNLNAHGNLGQLVGGSGELSPDEFNTSPWAGTPPSGGVPIYLPRGQGYGPAEVNLAPLFTDLDEYALLLEGGNYSGRIVEGRYGQRARTGVAGIPGAPSTVEWHNWRSRTKTYNYPLDYFNTDGTIDADPADFTSTFYHHDYGTPPDLDGNGAWALDYRGQPFYHEMGMPEEVTLNPYLVDLSLERRGKAYNDGTTTTSGTIDHPFDMHELERLLRYGDLDAWSLPGRLLTLAQGAFETDAAAQINRRLVTTDSWDVPVPGYALPVNRILPLDGQYLGTRPSTLIYIPLAEQLVARADITAMLRARVAAEVPNLDPAYATAAEFNAAVRSLLSTDLTAGLRMDLNRPFGNGRDDDGNGVVDEPGEIDPMRGYEPVWETVYAGIPGIWSPVDTAPTGPWRFDANNDGVQGFAVASDENTLRDDLLARQLYAKHLYVLAMLVLNDTDFIAQVAAQTSVADATEAQRLVARQVAQWAVNVVDFRDRDAIMTPFEYDIEPFVDNNGDGDPWDVDGDLTTDESASAPNVRRGVVWGCERPELLITETLAVHDRGTADLDTPGGLTTDDPPDAHFDQVRRPLGSLFIELYNPNGTGEAPPAELYDENPTPSTGEGPYQLQLDRTTPGGDPVWRIVVTRGDIPIARINEPTMPTMPDIERVIYFVTSDPGLADQNRPFWRSAGGSIFIAPGSYAVIGPGNTDAAPPEATTIRSPDGGLVDTIDIDLSGGGPSGSFDITGTTEPYPSATEIRAPVSIVIDEPRRLSVSEPYPGVDPNAGYDGWAALGLTNIDDPLPVAEDTPWDTNNEHVQTFGGTHFTGTDTGPTGLRPTEAEADRGRYIVFLQRLANPLADWDEIVNPYITVDDMPVDLTAYTGEDPAGVMSVEPGVVPRDFRLGTRQRDQVDANERYNVWSSITRNLPETNDDANTLGHTLGYQNEPQDLTNPLDRMDQTTLATATWDATVDPDAYIGAPQQHPAPWLSWGNRPFVSAYELLLVPSASPSSLLKLHSMRESASKPYGSALSDDEQYGDFYFDDAPYRHLLPWLSHSTDGMALDGQGPHFYRLLEYVHVPSRFTGTETILDPEEIWPNANVTGMQVDTADEYPRLFNPPFNRVSNYREPGKVNINTLGTDPRLIAALLNLSNGDGGYLSEAANLASRVVASRAGYGTAIGDVVDLTTDPAQPRLVFNNDVPSVFANPFRSPAGEYLVPIDALRCEGSVPQDDGGQIRRGVDCTLLRSDPVTSGQPLFAMNFSGAGNEYRDTDRNPALRYQLLNKLGNVLTTRSNVYAIWITVGYFEVTRTTVSEVYPDGWMLGRELGAETGDIRRHRAFYVIDRSIPVGFLRGEDLNVEGTILLERFIE